MDKLAEKQIDKAAQIIQNGGVVAFPTETVYGLGANALDGNAVARIFEIKKRPSFDPLIVHISRIEDIENLCVQPVDERVFVLAEHFWPGALTIVLPKNDIIPDIVTSGLPTVGIRIPSHPIALQLLQKSGVPIAAPSANRFGHVSPSEAQHVWNDLGDSVDMILDGGKTDIGIESTVITFINNEVVLLRPGGVTKEALEHVLQCTIQTITHEKKSLELSPGTLDSHYSPDIPLTLTDAIDVNDIKNDVGYIFLAEVASLSPRDNVRFLSRHGDVREMASNLFSSLRYFESTNVTQIIAEKIPESGLGIAIMDRLRKAAFQYLK